MARGRERHDERNNPLVIRMISLNKFIEGGAAIFAAEARNQVIVTKGKIEIIPLYM